MDADTAAIGAVGLWPALLCVPVLVASASVCLLMCTRCKRHGRKKKNCCPGAKRKRRGGDEHSDEKTSEEWGTEQRAKAAVRNNNNKEDSGAAAGASADSGGSATATMASGAGTARSRSSARGGGARSTQPSSHRRNDARTPRTQSTQGRKRNARTPATACTPHAMSPRRTAGTPHNRSAETDTQRDADTARSPQQHRRTTPHKHTLALPYKHSAETNGESKGPSALVAAALPAGPVEPHTAQSEKEMAKRQLYKLAQLVTTAADHMAHTADAQDAEPCGVAAEPVVEVGEQPCALYRSLTTAASLPQAQAHDTAEGTDADDGSGKAVPQQPQPPTPL